VPWRRFQNPKPDGFGENEQVQSNWLDKLDEQFDACLLSSTGVENGAINKKRHSGNPLTVKPLVKDTHPSRGPCRVQALGGLACKGGLGIPCLSESCSLRDSPKISEVTNYRI
jgi:hypothetical protein